MRVIRVEIISGVRHKEVIRSCHHLHYIVLDLVQIWSTQWLMSRGFGWTFWLFVYLLVC